MPSTITGFWGSVTFYCKLHPEQPMQLMSGVHGAYYGCHKELGNCKNRITLNEAEKCLQRLMNVITEASEKGDMINITNYKFTIKGIEYKVLSHDTDNDRVEISVYNKKLLLG